MPPAMIGLDALRDAELANPFRQPLADLLPVRVGIGAAAAASRVVEERLAAARLHVIPRPLLDR